VRSLKHLIPDWVPRWPGYFILIVVFIFGFYQTLDSYFLPAGVAESPDQIREIYRQIDPVYASMVNDELFWSFPFPARTEWRKVLRGSYVELSGKAKLSELKTFLEQSGIQSESSGIHPSVSGNFEFVRGESTTKGYVDMETGKFRISSHPSIPRD